MLVFTRLAVQISIVLDWHLYFYVWFAFLVEELKCACCLSRPKPCCFNCCSEGHQLRDCPEVFLFNYLQYICTIFIFTLTLLCFEIDARRIVINQTSEPFKPFHFYCLSPKIWLVSMKKERSFHRTAIRATNATMQKKLRSDLQSTSRE